MTETAVSADLLEALKVVTELRVDSVGEDLPALAIDNVPLPVQEPRGDLELRRVLHDRHDALELVRVELAGANIILAFDVQESEVKGTHRLLRSTSAFLQTKLE